VIPTIETIVEDLAAGKITKQQAIQWLQQHAEDAGRDMRDEFAANALQGLLATDRQESVTDQSWREIGMEPPSHLEGVEWNESHWRQLCAVRAYGHADAMLAERAKGATHD
jgi:hypothetical protein